MKRAIALALLGLALPPAAATTYDYAGLPYSTGAAYLQNFTPPCTAGACANYTTAMRVTGRLVTATPIPAGQSAIDISASVTDFSFADGLHTYAKSDPTLLVVRPFVARTDAAGNLVSLSAIVGRWQSPTAPHAAGSRLDYVELGGFNASLNAQYDQGQTNNYCSAYVAAGDTCTAAAGDTNSSRGVSLPLGTWTKGGFDLNRQGLTGSWFQAATSGQGVELEVYPDLVAPGTGFLQGAWFTYDAPGTAGPAGQRWYTFSGNLPSGQSSASMVLYENTGGNFNAPPATSARVVGNVVFSAADCDHASMNYTFTDGTGRTGSIALTRLLPNVACVASGPPPTNPDFGYSGNWFDPATSGQGIVFELNPVQPLAWLTWYTYAPNGQSAGAAGQRWYTAQAAYAPGARRIPMTVYETTGGAFDKAVPAPVTVPVGTATATFVNCTALKLEFNFSGGSSAGASGTINMQRVGPVPAGCGP